MAGRQIVGGGRYGRELYGVTVTFESDTGSRLTLHRQGKPTEILPELCAHALLRDPSFRLAAYSTPQTIYADLTGARADYQDQYDRTIAVTTPEMAALARVGLTHLLHPRLQPASRRRDMRTDKR